MMHRNVRNSGFTLIELSIVLVIIGLIVGGILVGQDLIKAAEVRAQISQIEKYNQAVNTFRAKFNAIPGDMSVAVANQFGFITGTGCDGVTQGWRDGNGLIDGWPNLVLSQTVGETALFWQDIGSGIAGNLIGGQFPNNNGGIVIDCQAAKDLNTTPGTTFIGDYLPAAKIGHGNYVYVYETGGFNRFGVSAITAMAGFGGVPTASATIPVAQAYNMDKKVDDGLPTTGVVQTAYIVPGTAPNSVLQNSFSAPADSATTCYNTANNSYSISSLANYGANGNCALSFRFQ